MKSIKSVLTSVLALVSICTIAFSQTATLSFGEVDLDAGTAEIMIDTPGEVAGFQFNMSGFSLTGASGGAGNLGGWQVQTSGSGTVLGFVFGSTYIQPGLSTLTILSFSDFDGMQACITDGVVSGPPGEDPYDVAYGACFSEGGIAGCMDDGACNFDPDATEDDGSCVYPEGCNFWCEGDAGVPEDEDCAGVCGGNAVYDDCDVCDGGNTDMDCAGVCNGNAYYDDCDVCDDDPSNDCGPTGATIYYGAFDEVAGTVEIWLDTPGPVAGFQFDVSGLALTGASGGAGNLSGWQVQTSGSGTVLGFVFGSTYIPTGDDLLTVLSFSGTTGIESCLSNGVVSGPPGEDPYDVNLGDCLSLGDGLPGCMDMGACNYNPDVTEDDGSCVYPEGCNDWCEGDAGGPEDEDCAGDCGGDAYVDDCGVCDGFNADMDCAGECFGNAMEDCAGDCGGDAYVDDCGVCDGFNADMDCAGDCFGNAYYDDCDVCDDDPSNDCEPDGATLYFGAVDVNAGTAEVWLDTPGDVAGFQFVVSGISLTGAHGGAGDLNGWQVSTSGNGTVLGFVFGSTYIPAGDDLLTVLEFSDVTDMESCITDGVVSAPPGEDPYGVSYGDCYVFDDVVEGCMDDGACNYDSDATEDDESCVYALPGEYCFDDEVMSCPPGTFSDEPNADECMSCPAGTYNDMVGASECMDCEAGTYNDMSGAEFCMDCEDGYTSDEGATECYEVSVDPVHFVVEIDDTGITSLVSIANIECLSEGDEVGLYDTSGQINYNNCDLEIGEVLVGSGVYTGGQLDIVGIGSVDLCAFGGVQLPGYVEGNDIVFKVWNSSDDVETTLAPSQVDLILGNGTWGQIVTQVEIDACSVVQTIDLGALMWNNISFYVSPLDNEVSTVFGDVNTLVTKNDAGQFFVPSIGVNTIGSMEEEKGYQVFLSGMEDQTLFVVGSMIDPAVTPITINPLMMNNIAYLLSGSANIADVMADIPVLLTKDASGNFYVPGIGVNTIDNNGGMQPGRGYEVFLDGTEAATLTYTGLELSRYDNSFDQAIFEASISEQYQIVKTGQFHPIVITSIQGNVETGDEIVAYANGIAIGATRIVDIDAPIAITAWEGYHEFDMDIDGYNMGDKIDLRMWSQSQNKEMRLVSDLDGDFYGTTPLTTGSLVVYTDSAVPTQYQLEQNYPNPFNPGTVIGFSLPTDNTVSITIFDMNGRTVSTLIDNVDMSSGYHSVMWNGKDMNNQEVSAGVYIYSLKGEGVSKARKMIMIK
ncbi:MAG: T9SS type A sorting domain-containing protein [Candidatus Marinimicrobia bacterium]|nr:T9SS type A sorting domain-containing protein [Candidatus Neomarinimicrobiota bacterium]MBT7884479.1 T9SS type A sorting domain-containing protein [Candidatus Neomarinimicrobiota bacterium]